ncbi:MAG: ATP-binding protein, partial [Candidatus Krumholzibacteriia bacterium]
MRADLPASDGPLVDPQELREPLLGQASALAGKPKLLTQSLDRRSGVAVRQARPTEETVSLYTGDVQRYQSRLSGPILDRIDLRVEVGVPSIEQMVETPVGDSDSTRQLRERIAAARARQAERYAQFEAV